MGGHSLADGRLVSLALVALLSAAAVAAAPAAATGTAAPTAAADTTDATAASSAVQENGTEGDVDRYAVTQGGNCVEVVPFGDGEERVERFYRYGLHWGQYSAQGEEIRPLQEWDESQLLVHDGSRGASLVFVHGETGSERQGGVASVTLSGVPPESEWAVRDDNYTHRTDNYSVDGRTAHADWFWGHNRTDGGALRGLESGNYESITVDPGFNVDSHHANLNAPLTVDSWRLRSGDGRSVTLAMDEPVSIRPGSCDDVAVQVAEDDGDRFNATVRNVVANDTVALNTSAALEIDGVRVDSVTVDHPGDAEWYRFGVHASNETPAPDGVSPDRPLLYAEPRSTLPEEDVEDVQYEFSVDGATLDDRDIDPREIAVYQYRDGEWVRLHHLNNRYGDDWAFRTTDAEGSGPVVLVEQQPDIAVRNVTLSESSIRAGDEVEITATVVNEGNGNGTEQVDLTMFGQPVDRASVSVPPGESQTVTFTRTVESPGTYTVAVGDAEAELSVEGDGGNAVDDTASSGSVPTALVAGAVVAVAVVAGIGYRAR